MNKRAIFKTKGMQRDLSVSAFNSEYSYENMNMRVYPSDENTLLSLINEKGTKVIEDTDLGITIKGTPIGQSLIDNKLILFTSDKDSKTDRIYRIEYKDNSYSGVLLYEGNLEFDPEYPIETLSFYENEELEKVYWTDGKSQPRVINIAASEEVINKWTNTSFDFVQKLPLKEKVTIVRNDSSSGNFPSGVIQYAFTYLNLYGQESNIFYTSPLYYTSFNNRGGSPEDNVSNCFNIEITNVDPSFDYVRIYSILRTSINATPEVKRVIDIAPLSKAEYILNSYTGESAPSNITLILRDGNEDKTLDQYSPVSSGSTTLWQFDGNLYSGIIFGDNKITWDKDTTTSIISYSESNKFEVLTDNNKLYGYLSIPKISYTDNGVNGETIDPTELLYVGGEEVVFGTMTQKDNTLFLGDIKIKRKYIDKSVQEYFKNGDIRFDSKELDFPVPSGYYPYDNQLKLNSYQFKTFKYLEYYRFGVQFQHYTGKWSEPIWVNDVKNTVHIDTNFYDGGTVKLPIAEYVLNNTEIINKLIGDGYINIRPVVVYPTLNDRECICQGVLCPTVYNVSDRYSNSPFAQSSWFTRPNAPFDITKSSDDWLPLGELDMPSKDNGDLLIYSRAGILSNNNTTIADSEYGELELTNKGAWAEFRHNMPIPGSDNRNAEIQCIWRPPKNPYISEDKSDLDVAKWVSENSEYYYIDQSIVTLHSPDIEFDTNIQNIDSSNLKLRIIGVVPITSFNSDIDIQTSTSVLSQDDFIPMGFYKEHIGVENDFSSDSVAINYGASHHGWKGLISGAFWFDNATGEASNPNEYTIGYAVYPWHRNGSLNNTKYATDGYRSAMLSIKRMLNYRYSYKTVYLDSDELWTPTNQISGVSIFNSNEVSVVRIPSPKNSDLPDINYYGNIDKLLFTSRTGDYSKEEDDGDKVYHKGDGYPIVISGMSSAETTEGTHSIFTGKYKLLSDTSYKVLSSDLTGVDPVRIRYKSSPHAVMALNYIESGVNAVQEILPTIVDGNADSETWDVNNRTEGLSPGSDYYYSFWDKNKKTIRVTQLSKNSIKGPINNVKSLQHGWLWLGELYNDNVQNRFGGQTDEAFENNQWLSCGSPVSLMDDLNNPKESLTVVWEEGDTYYQRYDHIKTYPFSTEDQNQVTDIVSFMCETKVNIDGRYDRNRGQSNLSITPENFNKLNEVYSQNNNFFNYRAVNYNKINLDKFHNTITWTKTKTNGEVVDSWTNITLASTLDLDGDKGPVRALRRLNNNILAFQDKGISQILYNESMQIASTEGVPIEIANSGKVNGKRYITDKVGCTNKWSICETPNGIYFIDEITKGIFLFNGQLNNISDKLGFHSWINKVSKGVNIWNPVDFNSFVTYYDKVNGDVFFISKEQCLAFSEPLGQFSSFYSYENTPYFSNLKDNGIWIRDGKLWLHNEGEYNMFFGEYKPFYTTIVVNPDMPLDKIFNILEFRADSWNGNTLLNKTFDTLSIWNEYQNGTAKLNSIMCKPSNLKQKFRIWRAYIPRDSSNNRDRIRNPWIYLKLSSEDTNTNKTLLHDMTVYYFE